jgi:MoaA/NifB/PqqE/SkfB family radical SAM enzyme
MDTFVTDPVIADRAALSAVAKAPLPESIYLDWTDYCNAKCFFCYREKYEQQIGGRGEFIPFAKLRKLEGVLSSVKVFGISSGIGEPLLHPELKQILDWLYHINPTILIRTTTNGTALTAEKAAWFAGHIDWLSVSLNASNAEAHLRDMFPHLVKRGIDAEQRWNLHLRHLTEFIAALPAEDRARIRFQMVAHRHNIGDIVDFVDVVKRIGGSHAVITNIAVHAETVDWSLYWDRDAYNDAVDEACVVGARLGVRVDAARFFTSVKPVLDLDVVCRDPIDIAYISRASVGAPCCQWAEAGIPTDVYTDEEGFERYWNHDILRRLRRKRDMESCRVCGMSRVFDEASFHFSPKLKQDLIGAGRLNEIDSQNDYPDAELVRVCVNERLDLPTVRRSLLRLDLPLDPIHRIETEGLTAVLALDDACWRAFQVSDELARSIDIDLAGPFVGIGWGPPLYEPQNRLSARWLWANGTASMFVRVPAGQDYEIRLTAHHIHPAGLAEKVKLAVGERVLKTVRSFDEAGRTVLSAMVPDDLVTAHEGRLWLRIACGDGLGGAVPGANLSFMHLRVSDTCAIEGAQMRRSPFARAVLASLRQQEDLRR